MAKKGKDRKPGSGRFKRVATILKQEKVLKGLLDGKTMEKAGADAGYSPDYIQQGGIVRTKTWKQLVATQLDDNMLLKHHKRLLEKEEKFSTKWGIERTGEPHSDVVKALDLAYKLKSRYVEGNITVNNFANVSDDELIRRRFEIAKRVVRSGLRTAKKGGEQQGPLLSAKREG